MSIKEELEQAYEIAPGSLVAFIIFCEDKTLICGHQSVINSLSKLNETPPPKKES